MSDENIWAVIPAAGVGKRVGDEIPKQYLRLHHQTIIEWSLMRLLSVSEIKGVVVVLSEGDSYWPELSIASNDRIRTTTGGFERSDSVINGLQALSGEANDNDWVLVHDAARPCVRVEDIRLLIDTVTAANEGGILAIPAKDTLKLSKENNKISRTINRNSVWHALTPQMFRLGQLVSALEQARQVNTVVTDEALAMETAGFYPLLVRGHGDNIKVTVPEDLPLAAYFLGVQGNLNADDQNRTGV